ncbi:putative allantoate permease protein [Neofusicoccum parvum UCRNP2]|uniref:Putative allantoate permease protein n=1 Tax=Botryosphaeria parva (strain UCR-NP2) TaxID=1287680 RepID=R1E885_BOTPV|nr:putative allantoate permease protein [Neofusicoccum parvum UCRNP2]
MAANGISDKKDVSETSDLKDVAGSESRDESINDVEIKGDYGSGRDHLFADPKVADYWRNIYENAKYEGRHRFDPTFTWSAEEEIRVKRKPDTVLYITYWYKSKELPIRLSWFWTVLSTCNIVGSFLAAGILQMRGLRGWSGWQYLFLIEGCITTVIGVLSWAIMPPGPCQTAGRWRGKGWFDEHEEKILVNRILRDDPSKGDMHNRQGVDLQRLWKCVKDYDLWPLYLVGLTTYIPPNPPQNYLSFILRQMGFSTFKANLLTIPSQFLFGVNLLIISRISEWLNERALVSATSNIWIFPWLVALVSMGASASPWVRYALLTGLLSYPYCHAILVAWNSKNSNTVRTRAVSAALYNMFVQAGNIVGSNIYREDDRPLYQRGNKILLGICCFNIVLFVVVKYYYVNKNQRREKAWAKLTGEEKIEYIHNTKDEGAKRLDFRFSH